MKTGILYASKTGHSKKIAKACALELQLEAMDIRTNPMLDNYDQLFIIGGIYGGQSSPELVEYVKNIKGDQAKKVVIMTSSCGKNTPQTQIRSILADNGVLVEEEEFTCQGSFLFFGLGHPNANDMKDAISFVKKFAS